MIQKWERIYLTEGIEGLALERRGRGSKGGPHKLPKEIEKDLLVENQRLRSEPAYLKNCKPWFWKKSDTKAKSKGDPGTETGTYLATLLEIAQLPKAAFYYHRKKPRNGR